MRLARRVSRRLPVPPRRIEHLAFCSTRVGIVVRQPAPLPGHPLPTTGLGGREVAFSVRRSDGAVSSVQGGGAESAVDGEGSRVVWIFGSVSVSDEGAGREVDVARKKQSKVIDEAEAVGGERCWTGGGVAWGPGIWKRGWMDDGLGADGGGVRDRIAARGTEDRTSAEARRRAGILEARGDAERGLPGTRAAGREDAGEGPAAVPLDPRRVPQPSVRGIRPHRAPHGEAQAARRRDRRS